MAERVPLIACAIFASEFRRLPESLRDRFEVRFLDSMLHMVPEELDRRLARELPEDGRPAALLYGDCSPHMREYSGTLDRARTGGCNCIEILLGSERYRHLLRDGAFFLMPEWAVRWEEVFQKHLGLGDPALARDFMKDNAREIVYLDTGGGPPPEGLLADISGHLGLPVRVERTGLDRLEAALRTALDGTGHA
jgi:hypothetical protein